MPPRRKVSPHDARLSTVRSLKEWGIQQTLNREHKAFSEKVIQQVLLLARDHHQTSSCANEEDDEGPQIIFIPKDREEAIRIVFEMDLQEYVDGKEVRWLEVEDKLERLIRPSQDESRILGLAPFYVVDLPQSGMEIKKKYSFKPFRQSDLDPLNRFVATKSKLSRAELALENTGLNDGWMLGYTFEALVVSFAVHNNVACHACGARDGLQWSGGSASSWRDMFCRHCNSCYEIKSKADREKIDQICRCDKLYAGSYRRWCSESYPDRKKGSDYIVFVSRKPFLSRSTNELVWSVQVAEISRVLPNLKDVSFAERNNEFVSIGSIVTMKHRNFWFNIPKGQTIHVAEIFRKAFENIFPGEYDKLTSMATRSITSIEEQGEKSTHHSSGSPQAHVKAARPATNEKAMEDLKKQFKEQAVVDDWEELSSGSE